MPEPIDLKGLSWASLERKALASGVSVAEIKRASDRNELRVLIFAARMQGT